MVRIVFTFIFLLTTQMLFAKLSLSSLFTDNMVLQQQKQVPIWGWANKGEKVTIKTSWDKKTYRTNASTSGNWKIELITPKAGGPYAIEILAGDKIVLQNVLIGEVWLCSGQSNMEMPLKGYPGQPIEESTDAIIESKNKNIRFYTVPRNPSLKLQENSKPSDWKISNPENSANFSATAYFFAKRLHQILEVPVGVILCAYGGSNIETWMHQEWLKEVSNLEIPSEENGLKNKNRIPTMLFNGMVNPIVGFGLKGILWYQGESNYEIAESYERLFTGMVQSYRKLWNDDQLPFYYAQIAPFDYASLPPYHKEDKFNSAFIRDAQRKSLDTLMHSGMVVTLDIGEEECIHPSKKSEVGDRFAMLALQNSYFLKGINGQSPIYDKYEIHEAQAIVHFRECPLGLTSHGKELKNFEIAGEDKLFYPANAIIKGKAIVVSSPKVSKPAAVRYGFKDFVIGDLFGVNGLPVSSFRTDDW
ncbi:sialate O-acetylesterase [Sphingobacterium bovistauri]|uniref:Sialate O-acetylesterase n=1 Tax=Sphingobacterium bovistauri TaxID=2781959 RepID=A0ABS7Z595_9SPHI|nr:sialate O-acetylesterase [Sphingobacterium bovistauri]MCA5004742.1 sialate O-acetylesterase [Sphingobacterium bovistauri]